MKTELTHMGPLLIIGLICLLVAYAMQHHIPGMQPNQYFFTYVIENSLGY
ncbi:hypothetical protein [Mucilaginibacter sp.]